MRNWNFYSKVKVQTKRKRVFSLPMRNWNFYSKVKVQTKRKRVFSLPMRNWNLLIFLRRLEKYRKFLAYLWGIETAKNLFWPHQKSMVFSLPMRNWNTSFETKSYGFEYVFSLPMRNWNNTKERYFLSLDLFLAYLWGIETYSFNRLLTIENEVFSLPMRNWNLQF